MLKLKFQNWLESGTQTYQSGAVGSIPTPQAKSTVNPMNQTVIGDISQPSVVRQEIDPDISSSATDLHDIHKRLQGIFQKVRVKLPVNTHPQIKQSFERELVAGVDGVGRAYTILLPTAQGIQ